MELHYKHPRLITPVFPTENMSEEDIIEKLQNCLESFRDNCGRAIMPQSGDYPDFNIRPLLSWYNSDKFYFLSKLDNRVIVSKSDIYMNALGSVEYYGKKMSLSAEKFSALMSKKIEIRLIDLMHVQERALEFILDDFKPIKEK